MLKIVNSKPSVAILIILGLSAVTLCSCRTVVYGETQEEYASSTRCSEPSVSFNLDTSDVCQSNIGMAYRYSRWVYYTIDKKYLPKGDDGKEYIPPIGISNGDVGIVYGDSTTNSALGGWLTVDPSMSDCIIENGGFWRRGYFQYKEGLFQERSYNGKTFGATQEGIAPIGFTGRSSDNIHKEFDVGWNDSSHSLGEKYPEEFTVNGVKKRFELGRQTLYYGKNTDVWAKMDKTKGMIGDSEAEGLYKKFSGDSKGFDYGDYFLSDYDAGLSGNLYDGGAGNATVLFCYSERSPFNGEVKIGSSNASYAYEKKKHGEAAKYGIENGNGYNNSKAIDLGEVNTQDYTLGFAYIGVTKDDNKKSGKTSYKANITQDGYIKYAYNGKDWVESTREDDGREIKNNFSATKAPKFTLHEGRNTLCIQLRYKENDSDKNYQLLQACASVNLNPATAVVKSDTLGIIQSKDLASGGGNGMYSSHANGKEDDKLTFNSIKVNPGPMDITWKHYLGYKELTGWNASTVKTKYGVVNDGSWRASPAIIKKYQVPAIPGGYNLEEFTAHTGVFPGETREEKRSIYHPIKVRPGTGDSASDSNDYSSVTLNIYADDLRCGLDNAHMYNIGVNHPDDYFWLSMQRGDSNKVTVGSGMASRANLWFNPSDQMRVTQVACFGRQILVDSKDRLNKWTTNPWEINGATLDNHAANTMFRLGGDGHDAIKNTGVFTNKSAANYVGSHGGSSLWASEIGGTSSTPSVRISKGYKLEATSETKQISNLGEDLQLTFSNPKETQSASINAKVPYNYYLDLSFSGSDGSTILDGVTSFKPKVTNEGRDNAQLCAGRESTCSAASIGTSTRTTHAATLIFSVDDSFTYEALKNSFDFAVDGNNTTERGILNSVKSRLGNAINVIDGSYFSYKDSGKKAISTNGYWKLNNPTTVDSRDYPVGTKICGVVAAYPADSHNTGDGRAIDDDAQIAAFNSYGGIFKTKFNISCRTVAKRQTMSVEGNGITALGLVKSSRVYYGTQNRIFGSWSEYQIIASGSDGKSASSGAVTAYGLDGTGGTTETFATKAADTSSISGNGEYTLLFPQSLGNTKGDPYAPYEAKINWQYSENLISLIKNKYVSSNGSCVDITENRRALRCFTGDQSLGNSQVSIADMDTIVIYSSGKLTITENLSIPDTSRQLIIIAKSIEIANNVNEVNAWLIVDGGEFNTCAGHIIDQPNHPENPNSYGNMELLQECYNNLKINGPVILKTGKASGHNMIQLPRTFGGGSKPDGDSFVRAPETYVQRAEVFNYDPEIVEWAYNESRKEPQIVTTYTESLTPRL